MQDADRPAIRRSTRDHSRSGASRLALHDRNVDRRRSTRLFRLGHSDARVRSLTRARLPNRRAAELIDFEHQGRRWTATISRFPDGRVAEVFLSASKVSALAEMAAELAIVASLALQSGVLIETM